MSSEILQKARQYETSSGELISPQDRPLYHLTPMVGWMNDPNGFSFYNGRYHMFYQYHPYSLQWGPMHWGHAVSSDLLRWEYLPAALAPDSPADNAGCFSGSAVTTADGQHLLMYTGVQRVKDENGQERDVQNQCVAVGDGLNYHKAPENPVIDGESLPENFSRADFRDPKAWREADGSYRCVVANRTEDGSGAILLFSSPDGIRWKYESILDRSRNRLGKMWECPDFFPLDGKHILMINPQEMPDVDLEFRKGNNTASLIGSFDGKNFSRESVQNVDYGLDFYATQTTLAPDGRRILIAWMQDWDCQGNQPAEQKWNCQLTIPRELCLKDGKLIQKPIRELEAFRRGKVSYTGVKIPGIREQTMLPGIQGRIIDLELTIRPDADCREFQIRFAADSGCYTALSYCPRTGELTLDRTNSGVTKGDKHRRTCRVENHNGALKLRLLLDRFSAEIFVNDGEQTLSAAIYTPRSADGIRFLSDGEAALDAVKYEIAI